MISITEDRQSYYPLKRLKDSSTTITECPRKTFQNIFKRKSSSVTFIPKLRRKEPS